MNVIVFLLTGLLGLFALVSWITHLLGPSNPSRPGAYSPHTSSYSRAIPDLPGWMYRHVVPTPRGPFPPLDGVLPATYTAALTSATARTPRKSGTVLPWHAEVRPSGNGTDAIAEALADPQEYIESFMVMLYEAAALDVEVCFSSEDMVLPFAHDYAHMFRRRRPATLGDFNIALTSCEFGVGYSGPVTARLEQHILLYCDDVIPTEFHGTTREEVKQQVEKYLRRRYAKLPAALVEPLTSAMSDLGSVDTAAAEALLLAVLTERLGPDRAPVVCTTARRAKVSLKHLVTHCESLTRDELEAYFALVGPYLDTRLSRKKPLKKDVQTVRRLLRASRSRTSRPAPAIAPSALAASTFQCDIVGISAPVAPPPVLLESGSIPLGVGGFVEHPALGRGEVTALGRRHVVVKFYTPLAAVVCDFTFDPDSVQGLESDVDRRAGLQRLAAPPRLSAVSVGARVHHDVFGAGTVFASAGSVVKIRFDAPAKERMIDLTFAPLRMLPVPENMT